MPWSQSCGERQWHQPGLLWLCVLRECTQPLWSSVSSLESAAAAATGPGCETDREEVPGAPAPRTAWPVRGLVKAATPYSCGVALARVIMFSQLPQPGKQERGAGGPLLRAAGELTRATCLTASTADQCPSVPAALRRLTHISLLQPD